MIFVLSFYEEMLFHEDVVLESMLVQENMIWNFYLMFSIVLSYAKVFLVVTPAFLLLVISWNKILFIPCSTFLITFNHKLSITQEDISMYFLRFVEIQRITLLYPLS